MKDFVRNVYPRCCGEEKEKHSCVISGQISAMKLFRLSVCFCFCCRHARFFLFVCFGCLNCQSLLSSLERLKRVFFWATADMHIPRIASNDFRTRKTNLLAPRHLSPCNSARHPVGKVPLYTANIVTALCLVSVSGVRETKKKKKDAMLLSRVSHRTSAAPIGDPVQTRLGFKTSSSFSHPRFSRSSLEGEG